MELNFKETKTLKNKKLILLFFGLIIILMILFVFFVFKRIYQWQQEEPSITRPEKFKDCRILSENCKDSSCEYLAQCQSEGEYETCQTYDCGEYFGVVINKKENEKPNKFVKSFQKQTGIITKEKREEIRENCKGSLEIIEQKCEGENNFTIKAKVNTQGKCEIYRFVAKTGENAYETFKMEKAENNVYNLTLEKCLDEFELFAVGEMGLPIKIGGN